MNHADFFHSIVVAMWFLIETNIYVSAHAKGLSFFEDYLNNRFHVILYPPSYL
jgi:hypothetical protein